MSRRAVFLNVGHRQRRASRIAADEDHRPLLAEAPEEHRYFPWRERVVSVYEEVRERRSHDRRLLARNLLIAVNACSSIVLMVAMVQLGWRDSSEWRNNESTRAIKIVLSSSTAVLVLQILDLYRAKVLDKTQEIKTARKPWVKRKLHIFNPMWLVVWKNSSLRWKFWCEVAICCFHPFPGTNAEMTKTLGMAMFLRAYVLLHLARCFNPIYIHRALIQKIPGLPRARMLNFSTWMVVKIFFHSYPIPFILTGMTFLLSFTSYGMYIYEREAEEKFTYGISVYVAVSSMLIGWPDDVYVDYDPTTWGAKFFAFVAAISGLFFFALLIDYVHTRMHPSHADSLVVDWITRLRLENKEKEEAARLIQLVWRSYRRRKHKHERHAPCPEKGLRSAPGRKTYWVLLQKQCKQIRKVRKEIDEIRERTSQAFSTFGTPLPSPVGSRLRPKDAVLDSGAGTGSTADNFDSGEASDNRERLIAQVVKNSHKRLIAQVANLLAEHQASLLRELQQMAELSADVKIINE
jgi:hypothetical protein